ncbi:MAG: MFS transporter, partial [Caulobacteraceae bacterium]
MAPEDHAPARLRPAAAAALLGSNVLVFLGIFALAPDLPAVKAHFAAMPNAGLLTQLVGAMAGLTFALGSLAVGRLINRFGYRAVYTVSLLAFAIAGPAAAVMPDLYLVILTRMVVGLASAGIVNAALVAIGRLLPEAAQARMLGLQTLIGSVVAIVGFPLVGQLAGIDWRLAFLVHLVALLFVPLVLTLPVVGEVGASGAPLPSARSVGRLILATAVFSGMVIFIATIFGPLFLASMGVSNPSLLSIPPT